MDKQPTQYLVVNPLHDAQIRCGVEPLGITVHHLNGAELHLNGVQAPWDLGMQQAHYFLKCFAKIKCAKSDFPPFCFLQELFNQEGEKYPYENLD